MMQEIKNNKKTRPKYSGEFKISVIIDMRTNNLGYSEVVRKYWGYDVNTHDCAKTVKRWEKIYLEKGVIGLMNMKSGRSKKEKNIVQKNDSTNKTKEELLAENQYLRMENEYLKKLNDLVEAEEQENSKKL